MEDSDQTKDQRGTWRKQIIQGAKENKANKIKTLHNILRNKGLYNRGIRTGLFFFFYKFIYLFIFGCVGSSLLCTGFLWLRREGITLCCRARASHCGGFSCCRARALGARASVVVARGLSSCGTRA